MRDVNVLIVDDNEMTRALLRSILSAEGYIVVGEASNGKNGLEQAMRLKPDVLCLDIMMPDGCGVDLLKEIKKELPKTVVMMVSAQRDADTVKECLAHGATGFILKPFNAGIVTRTVKEAVMRAAMH
ncbi:MAG TPA: response regulator [Burkholderiaceae bacterium]